MRIRELGGLRRELAEMTLRFRDLSEETETLRGFAAVAPWPIWAKRAGGGLSYANAAYARATEAVNVDDAIHRNLELLDSDDRTHMARTLNDNQPFAARLPVVISGERRIYDVHALNVSGGSAGMAIDASEAAALSAALVRMAEAHRRTLDQLSSGVAIFDAQRRLSFYNDSYRRLWDLDRTFLDNNPDDSSVLDRLRAARKLPEQPDFRAWKARLHEAYRALEPAKDVWYLPDGRALSIVTTPNPEGGVTYLFDDVTESLELARRFDGLIRVQRETLDNLAEAVAVFGSNGRAQLFNPAFATMWKLSNEALQGDPHIETVEQWCRPLFDDDAGWQTLRGAITGIENRVAVPLKLERKDGSVLNCMTMPLPDGATMLTFQDISDAENVERALRERNEALETADQMKVDFVHHVSYELRSPLTTIIGFAHFLSDPATGPLEPKQAEYLRYITTSTDALMAIINNILDLATIDAGAMTLNLGPIDIRKTIDDAAAGIQDRLVRDRIALKIDLDSVIGDFIGDERRVVQVLYNLPRQCRRLFAAGFGDHVARRTHRPQRYFYRHRYRTRHSARRERQGVRLVRKSLQRLAASRRRPGPVPGALLRRIAWRPGAGRFRRRQGHHRDVQFSDRPDRASYRRGMSAPVIFSVALVDEAATANLMADLALLIGPGDVITLSGDLGAGKTAAARAMIRYLAGDDVLEVPSPTFTLVQAYDLPPFPVVHADLYRVNDPLELEEIGLSPLPPGAVALIEWPERAPDAFPADRIDIALNHRPESDASSRAAVITGYGKAAAQVTRLKALRDFLDGARYLDTKRLRMAGDASTRSYARLIRGDHVAILMNSPRKPDGPAIYDGKSYSAAVHLAEDVKPFVAIANGLRKYNFSAPAIQHADLDEGFLITEDFGAASFVIGDPPAPIPERYQAATDMLASLHGEALPHVLPIAPGMNYQIPVFDTEALLIESSLMLDWYLPDRGAPPSDELRAEFAAHWRALLATSDAAPRTWVLRDFHSPNLIWLERRDGIRKVGVIDIQDAVLGPAAYDLASLLQDARIDVPESIELAMLTRYIKARRAADPAFDAAGFAELYAIMSAQRNTKLLGIFARLNLRDGKPHYLRHQPRILDLSRPLAGASIAAGVPGLVCSACAAAAGWMISESFTSR